MTVLGPNGDSIKASEQLKGGVVLGGRELRLTISREDAEILKRLSVAIGSTPHDLATDLLRNALMSQWQHFLKARLIYQLTRWYTWPRS